MGAKFVDPQQNLVLQIWRQFRSVCLQRSSMLSQNRLIGERTTTILNMLSFLNILKDAMEGSVRGQNQPKDSCCLDSPSQCGRLLVSAKERKKLWETIHRFSFLKRTGSLIDHDCSDNKNKKQYI